MARQHQAALRREATQHTLARSARIDRDVRGMRSLITSMKARLGAATRTIARRDHSLTDYPCRLPDGSIGRIAVISQDGDWALVCVVA